MFIRNTIVNVNNESMDNTVFLTCACEISPAIDLHDLPSRGPCRSVCNMCFVNP